MEVACFQHWFWLLSPARPTPRPLGSGPPHFAVSPGLHALPLALTWDLLRDVSGLPSCLSVPLDQLNWVFLFHSLYEKELTVCALRMGPPWVPAVSENTSGQAEVPRDGPSPEPRCPLLP